MIGDTESVMLPGLRRAALVSIIVFVVPVRPDTTTTQPLERTAPVSAKEVLQYGVEWRLIRAGLARVAWEPGATAPRPSWTGNLQLESQGLVSKLHKVSDQYTVELSDQLCVENTLLKAQEGKRNRETKVSVDRRQGKAHYLERDLIRNTTVLAKETDVPACVQDVIGGLYRMRTLHLEPGQSANVPITDGKKFVSAKVEALDRETVKTPVGNFNTIRHEAHIFNGALFARNARCFLWLSDDDRRLPVRIQVRMRLLIGNITLTLEKHERS